MKTSETRSGQLVMVFIFVRLVVATAFRMVFPFLPALARGLGVSIEAVAGAVSARSALGILGPPLGALADMRGRKRLMVAALVVFGLGLLAVGIWPTYAVFFMGLLISGGATVVIDSSVHATLGDQIPYAQRGRATALVELGWSLAFVAGIPLVAINMARSGWSAPFIWLGLAGLLAGGLVGWVVPHSRPSSASWQELRHGLGEIFSYSALMGLVLALMMTLGNQVVSIVFGIWMEDSFGLKLEQLGAASMVIGLAGLGGVGCAVLVTDLIGKRMAIGLGLLVNAAACLALPLLRSHLWGALAVLFIFYLSFEFAITSLLPLMTTLSTHARGVFMAATLAAFSLGDSLGALLGPWLIHSGLITNVLFTVAINICGLLLLGLFVRPVERIEPI